MLLLHFLLSIPGSRPSKANMAYKSIFLTLIDMLPGPFPALVIVTDIAFLALALGIVG